MSTERPTARVLVVELWNIGDLTLSTGFLHDALAAGWEITVLSKAPAGPLLQATFPQLRFVFLDAPWTAFENKYQLWKWPFRKLWQTVRKLRAERFDAAISVRPDPRDHFLMWLIGTGRRVGFPARGSEILLTDPLPQEPAHPHRAEGWWMLGRGLGLPATKATGPALRSAAYPAARTDDLLKGIELPILCLHPGARISIRRWPAEYFATFLRRLRQSFRFHLLYIPERDAYDELLLPLADSVAPPLALDELVSLLGRVDLLLCNDSAPGHIAAACGCPVLCVFGPTDPARFRPWGAQHHLIIRDLCAYRPCFDYCVYAESYCLTRLLPDPAVLEGEAYLRRLVEEGTLDRRWLGEAASASARPE